MKNIITICLLFILTSFSFGQYKLSETFETTAPGSLPSGWTRYNRAAFPISTFANWTVRDTGSTVPQVPAGYKTKGDKKRSIAVSWYSSVDSTGFNIVHISDAWLASPRFSCSSNDSIAFIATGGAQQYMDSLQIWVNTTGITPEGFTRYIATIKWAEGSPYGRFTKFRYSLSQFSGQQIAVGFRYYTNQPDADGLLVQLDNIYVGPSVGIQNISSDIPSTYKLNQNYPNPFNPETTIAFDIPQNTFAVLKVYDMLGREVEMLVNEKLEPGSYKVNFDASQLSSGTYFYSLTTSNFNQTKKMTMLK